MRSLITGGAGFIGSHLARHLLLSGDDVVVLDDLSTGDLRNLGGSSSDPHLQVVVGSILDAKQVTRLVQDADRVFHLAAAVGVKVIVEHPLASLRTNIHGTENVLQACAETGTPLLLASTSEIYGKNESDALTEESDRVLGSPLVSRWTYAAAKGIDESFARAYWEEHDLPVSIVRLFNTVGPGQKGRYGMVLPNLVAQALRGDPLTVFGDGRQTRCFSAVSDIVPALVAILEKPETRGQAYNLGGAHEISIGELAELVLDVTGSASAVELVPYDVAYGAGYADMRRRVPDNSKAHRLIGFVPTTTVEEIVVDVAEHLRATASDPDWVMEQARVGASHEYSAS